MQHEYAEGNARLCLNIGEWGLLLNYLNLDEDVNIASRKGCVVVFMGLGLYSQSVQ